MDRSEFVEKLKVKLDEWNADIDALEARAQKAGTGLREESKVMVNELREKRDDIDSKLADFGDSMEEALSDVMEGIREAGEDLKASIADARNRFRHHDGDSAAS